MLFGTLRFGVYFSPKHVLDTIAFQPGFYSRMPPLSENFIREEYVYIEKWKDGFSNNSDWRAFCACLCDQFCEHYVLDQASDDNLYRTTDSIIPHLSPLRWLAIEKLAKEYPSYRTNVESKSN